MYVLVFGGLPRLQICLGCPTGVEMFGGCYLDATLPVASFVTVKHLNIQISIMFLLMVGT